MADLPYGIGLIESHTMALAQIADDVASTTPIPTCGDWTLADLTWHVAEVQDFWAHVIANRPAAPDDYEEPLRPSDATLGKLLRSNCRALCDALAAARHDESAWSWADDQTVGFTIRRQTHEAMVHHIDGVRAAGGTLPPITAELAADGVDELIDVMLTGVPDWATYERTNGSIRLAADDIDRSWTLAFGRMTGTSPASGTTYDLTALERDAASEPDATVTASALTLDLWMWGRADLDASAMTGSTDLAQRLRNAVNEASQ